MHDQFSPPSPRQARPQLRQGHRVEHPPIPIVNLAAGCPAWCTCEREHEFEQLTRDPNAFVRTHSADQGSLYLEQGYGERPAYVAVDVLSDETASCSADGVTIERPAPHVTMWVDPPGKEHVQLNLTSHQARELVAMLVAAAEVVDHASEQR